MKFSCKRFLRWAFPCSADYCRACNALVLNRRSYLHSTGWMRSSREGTPVDKEGNPLPWMNYPAIRFLEERLRKDLRLFEFGSGYSTSFYARHVAHVTSVEHDDEWLQVVRSMLPANATLIHQPQDVDGAYCRTIQATGQQYDVVIVDGRDRVNCLRQSLPALSATGVLLLDDSQRDRYREGIRDVREQGFRALNFEGLKPTGKNVDQTTLFYRPDNCLGL